MFKLTFTLAAALYAGFVIWGDPDVALVEDETAPQNTVVLAEGGADLDTAAPVVLETNASSRTAEIAVTRDAPLDAAAIVAATPDPAAPTAPSRIGEPRRISLVAPEAVAEPAAPLDAVAADAQTELTEGLLKVTGSRVNLRAGPSTGNDVVDSLVRGTLVEQVGVEINGWLKLRDVTSGVEGYMAARFLEPA